MLSRLRKNDDQGFTLIELLVVMIIIGILAAIAIPAFLNQKKKARETSAKSDVATISKEIAAYYVDGSAGLALTGATAGGTWELKEGTTLVASGKLSSGNTTVAQDTTANKIASGDSFCIAVKNGADTSPWKFSAKNGLVKGDCVAADL